MRVKAPHSSAKTPAPAALGYRTGPQGSASTAVERRSSATVKLRRVKWWRCERPPPRHQPQRARANQKDFRECQLEMATTTRRRGFPFVTGDEERIDIVIVGGGRRSELGALGAEADAIVEGEEQCGYTRPALGGPFWLESTRRRRRAPEPPSRGFLATPSAEFPNGLSSPARRGPGLGREWPELRRGGCRG